MLEFILQILGEFLVHFVLEVLTGAGGHRVKQKGDADPIEAGFLYLVLGAVLGGLSLLLFPDSFIRSEVLKLLNLIVTPIVLGLAMALIGTYRVKRAKDTIRIETFLFGFLFALGLALIRFAFTS